MGEQPRLALRDAQKPMPGSLLVLTQGLVLSRIFDDRGDRLPRDSWRAGYWTRSDNTVPELEKRC
ncbi:hypothetical protein A6U85_31735 [Agrobacterium sp. 13-626]|jgi:hypothetical protein|nr:hypothetical protein CN09_00905 [Rhizobium rhizogenes]OCI99360.1 hypothetical protein A6U85_31735 [Agrobacterium sp. 13-626]OCJ20385.1 hypothetical protein A6U88_31820 [Agrobacterium sp. B131/95]